MDAKAVMLHILKGEFGSPNVTDYVILETTLLLQQRNIPRGIKTLCDFLEENKIRILYITEDTFSEAMKMTIDKTSDGLSLTDSIQVILSKLLNIDTIATFDGVLGRFFKLGVGKNYFETLDEKEKILLLGKK